MSDGCEFEFTRADARAQFDVDGIDVDDVDEYWTQVSDYRGVDGDVWTCPHDAIDGETCPFHGDAETVDGEQQAEVLARTLAEVEQAGRDGGRRRNQFVGATFGDLDLSEADLTLPGDARLDFLGATFTGEADFEGCTLAAPTFAQATFEDRVRFDDAAFRGRTFFNGVQFAAKTTFVGATIAGEASFDGVDFEGRTELIRVAFEDDVSLDGVDCEDSITLYESTVDGDLTASEGRFDDAVYLSSMRVDGDLRLSDWKCYDRAWFTDTGVDGQLVVRESRFYRDETDADVEPITDATPTDDEDLAEVQFDGVECDRFALLDSVFFRPVDCSGAAAETVFFDDSGFLDTVDLGGCRLQTLGTRGCWFGTRLRMATTRAESSEFDRTRVEYLSGLHATLTDTSFPGSDLGRVSLHQADLSGADLSGLDLRGANLSSATLNRAVLDGTDLRGADLSGTALAGVHVDDGTTFLHPPVGEFDETHRIPRGLRAALPFVSTGGSYCGPDRAFDPPEVEGRDVTWPETDESAAKTLYRRIETIAGNHARSRLQSRAFVRGQDLRYAQLREREPFPKIRYWFSRLQRGVFVYGESFARVVVVSLLVILTFGLLYPLGRWTSTVGPDGTTTPLTYARVAEEPNLLWRSVYHSAMMFATGNRYGGIEATTTLSQAITSVEALLGPTMLALVVFVLGRRAAR